MTEFKGNNMLKRLLMSIVFLGTLLNAAVPTETDITKVYIATYDRAPDAVGLDYWLNDSGLSIEGIAQSFFDQEEIEEIYPNELTNSEFIDQIYLNVFDHEADSTGKAYWLAELENGKIIRSQLILAITKGALDSDKDILVNKTFVGLAFANDGRNDLDEARAILVGVTADPKTAYTALCDFSIVDCLEGYLVVTPANVDVPAGETQQFTAMALTKKGELIDVTGISEWSSSDVSIATIGKKDGRATAIAGGEATITASLGSYSDLATINVIKKDAILKSLKIEKDDSLSTQKDDDFIVGETIKFKAVGTFENNGKYETHTITQYVVWTAGPNGTVSVDQNGLVTALKEGDASVVAAYSGSYGDASDKITGKVVAKTLSEVIVFSDPDPAQVAVGQTIRLAAWARYSDGDTQNISDTVKWQTDAENVTITVDKESHQFVTAYATTNTEGSIMAIHSSGKEDSKAIKFDGKVADYIEIQENYCENGNCPIITGKTIDIPIVDDVNYDPVSEGAYYPTAWLVYTDGTKDYINTQKGILWWSDDQTRAYVNTTRGSFVFGRGIGNGIEISVSYKGKHKTSFFVNVKEDTTIKTLKEIGIKNTKKLGWGCTQDDADYGQKLLLNVGNDGKYLQACGKFEYKDGTTEWLDINNNVAWFSTDSNVARVRTNTGELQALGSGYTDIIAQLAEIKGSINVTVRGR